MTSLPLLNRDLARSRGSSRYGVEPPDPSLLELPERVVQFGSGALLRGLVDAMLHDANRLGKFGGRVVAIRSTVSARGERLNRQDGLFTLRVEGLQDGASRSESSVIASVSRALSAHDDWPAVLECARNPALELVFSNTTEIGITLDEADARRKPDGAARSFPGKLTQFLHERAVAFGFDAGKGVVVLPCELIERNGDALRDLVLTLAGSWRLGARFERWLCDSVMFCNTLPDRIVTGLPSGAEAERLQRELGYRDDMITVCEPYRLLAIEAGPAAQRRLGFAVPEIGGVVVEDITPFRERKLRVLNGGHTSLAPLALTAGFRTVRDAVGDPLIARFLRAALFDEIVPVVPAEGVARFAQDVLDRFANPFIEHQLRDIALHGGTKMAVRVIPSIVAYARLEGRPPAALALGFAAYLFHVRFRGESPAGSRQEGAVEDAVAARLAERWGSLSFESEDTALGFTRAVCGDAATWGTDLAAIAGFPEIVARYLVSLERRGALETIELSFPSSGRSLRPALAGRR